jgi:hypothetical protein
MQAFHSERQHSKDADVNRHLQGLLIAAGLAVFSGASCPLRPGGNAPLPPVAFSAPPSLEQVVQVVNANSAPVRQLQAEGATLAAQGMPPLRADLLMERPRRFRLRGMLTSFTGPEIDMGSNDEVLWLWIKRNQPPATYFARHEQFHYSPAKQILPIEPHWLIEALGVAYLDPTARHEGPFETGDGRLEIRSRLYSPQGEMNRVTILDNRYGWVLEQHLHDASGRLVAVARASQHRHYPTWRVTLPHRVEVELPPAQMAFTFDVPRYVINQLSGDPAEVFALPQIEGYPLVDLADPRNFGYAQPPLASASPSDPSASYAPPPSGYAPGW